MLTDKQNSRKHKKEAIECMIVTNDAFSTQKTCFHVSIV